MSDSVFFDENHNGIDDRVENALGGGISGRFRDFFGRLLGVYLSPAEPLVPEPQILQAWDLKSALQRVKAIPARQFVRPATKTVPFGATAWKRSEPAGAEWCRLAGLSKVEGAGARLVQAEEGMHVADGYVQYGVGVALAALNEVAARRKTRDVTIFEVVTGDRRGDGYQGWFGGQSGRWCASGADPSMRSLECFRVAQRMLSPEIGWDFTRGARRWDAGKTQDYLWKKGKVKKHAVGICESWGAEGWEWVGQIYAEDGRTVMIDPYLLTFYRFVGPGQADVASGVAMLREGRLRYGVQL